MALILNIETATETCSVALAREGLVLSCSEQSEPMVHAAKLNLFIEEILKQSGYDYKDIDAVCVSKGPGSYTGLRIGVSAAKGLCFALDKPLLSVDTLLAFATYFRDYHLSGLLKNSKTDVLLCPMIDARRMEVYTALFDLQLNFVDQTRALILKEDSFSEYLTTHKTFFFGSGATKFESFAHTNNNSLFVPGCMTSAAGMAGWSEHLYNSGSFENVAYFEPFYLKDFIAVPPGKII